MGLSATAYIAIGSAVVGAGSAVYSADQRAEAAEKREEANELSRAIEADKAQQKRVQAVRQNRVQRAEIFAQATAGGTGGSSGTAGAMGSLTTQTASNIGFSQSIDEQRERRAGILEEANELSLEGQQIGNIGGAISSGIGSVGGALAG